jgi:cytidylate kinase
VKRRLKEYREKGLMADEELLKKDMAERDRSDEQRPVGPLCVPEGAVIIESSSLSIQEVFHAALDWIKKKLTDLEGGLPEFLLTPKRNV